MHLRIDAVDFHSEVGEGRLRRLGHGGDPLLCAV
jgi:hypothetical protein